MFCKKIVVSIFIVMSLVTSPLPLEAQQNSSLIRRSFEVVDTAFLGCSLFASSADFMRLANQNFVNLSSGNILKSMMYSALGLRVFLLSVEKFKSIRSSSQLEKQKKKLRSHGSSDIRSMINFLDQSFQASLFVLNGISICDAIYQCIQDPNLLKGVKDQDRRIVIPVVNSIASIVAIIGIRHLIEAYRIAKQIGNDLQEELAE